MRARRRRLAHPGGAAGSLLAGPRPGGRRRRVAAVSASRSWSPGFRGRSSSPSTRQGTLVVLSHGWRGDAAAELYRIDLRGSLPVDAAAGAPGRDPLCRRAAQDGVRKPRGGPAERGSLPRRGERQPHLSARGRPAATGWSAVGLNHLLGGSAIALDPRGRLVFLDYASPETHLRSETPLPPSLDWLTQEGYRGPVVFRLDVRERAAAPAARRSARADLAAGRNGRHRPGAALAAHRRDGVGGRRSRPLERRRGSVRGSGPTARFVSSPDCPPGTTIAPTWRSGPTGASSSAAGFRSGRSSGSRPGGVGDRRRPRPRRSRRASCSTTTAPSTSPRPPLHRIIRIRAGPITPPRASRR